MGTPARRPPDATARLVGIVAAVGLVLAAAGAVLAQDPSPSPDASVSPGGSASPSAILVPEASATPAASLIPVPPAPTPISHPSDGSSNSCFDCHVKLNTMQQSISEQWQDSVHGQGGVACADCHGGDPTSDRMGIAMDREGTFIGAPDREKTVGVCASCHSDPTRMGPYKLSTDQYAKYATSVHGQKLFAGDMQVAVCTDCHGVHDVKKASDPSAAVFPLNVPELCSSCHSDVQKMEPYGIPTDQFAVYQKSVHGIALLANDDTRAPSCASCHGSHDAKPPTSADVVNVCGKCHTATEELYLQSRHAELQGVAPKCWTCHGTHDVVKTSNELFLHETPPQYTCETCHDLQTKQLRINVEQFANEADRRCDTCHHPDSEIYAQVVAISDSLTGAEDSYNQADDEIARAQALGMIVNDADVKLTEAHTSLVQAKAAVHTTKLPLISDTAGEAQTTADAAAALAQAKLDESTFRRAAMVIVVALVLLNVVALWAVRRYLHRRSHAESPPS
jgi:hypothetical protein